MHGIKIKKKSSITVNSENITKHVTTLCG